LDNSVDFIISSHTVEHIKDVPKAMREWTRVLKPLGLIAITMPDVRYFQHETSGVPFDRDLAPSEMTPDQMREIFSGIKDVELLSINTNNNNFDFEVLARKKEA